MADPLSIFLSTLAIITAASQSVKGLFAIIKSIKGASSEILFISRDLQAFQSVIFSLRSILEDEDTAAIIAGDCVMLEATTNLDGPLESCQILLDKMLTTASRRLEPQSSGKRLQIVARNLRWGLFTRRELKNLRRSLQEAKHTLSSALAIVAMFCNLRLLSKTALSANLQTKFIPSRSSTDAALVCDGELQLEAVGAGVSAGCSKRGLSTVKDRTVFRLQLSARDFMTNIVSKTREAVVSENAALSRRLTQIYRTLGQQSTQLQILELATENIQVSMADLAFKCGEPQSPDRQAGVGDGQDRQHPNDRSSCAVDIFFDCIARLSINSSNSCASSLHSRFSGSPDYWFESGSFYFPEQYSTVSMFEERLSVIAVTVSKSYPQTLDCFLIYAATPRKWHRVHISATITGNQELSSLWKTRFSDTDVGLKFVPNPLRDFLNNILSDIELFDTVTSVQVPVIQVEGGELIHSPESIRAFEDDREAILSDEAQMIEDIQDLACPQFRESEIVTITRISASCFIVRAGLRQYVEQKARFRHAGQDVENGFRVFFSDLKARHALRDCPGITQLSGVVLDDTGQHLKGYLYESAPIALKKLMARATSCGRVIPWSLRAAWIGQIIRTLAYMHSRGFIAGSLRLPIINVRKDGSIAITKFQNSIRQVPNIEGFMPPELRCSPGISNPSLQSRLNFRTDIFQLGQVIWQLVENIAVHNIHICVNSGCTSFPRYACRDPSHTNPIELPVFNEHVPTCYKDIISRCRSVDPRDRPTAYSLLASLPIPTQGDDAPPSLDGLQDLYEGAMTSADSCICCCECTALITDEHFHCYSCREANFDLCAACAARGIHCWDRRHRLVRRVAGRGNGFVDSEILTASRASTSSART